MNLDIPERDFDGYIFDMDGTLVNTMPVHYRAWSKSWEPYDVEFTEDEFYGWGGRPAPQIASDLAERHGIDLDPHEHAHRKEEIYLEMVDGEVGLIDPVIDYFHRKQREGKKVSVATGSNRPIAEKILTNIGLIHLLHALVTSDDYERGKPSPDPFLMAAEQMGVSPEECLVFEDSKTGTAAADAAGMAWVYVNSRPQKV